MKTFAENELESHHEEVSAVNNFEHDKHEQTNSELDNGEIAPEAIGGTIDDLPSGYYRSFKFIGTMVAVYLGYVTASFSFGGPTNILATINQDIGPDPNYVWFAIVWNLASAIGFVFVGRVSDLVGRRWFFIIGNGLGTLGSIISGVAPNIPSFIVGGALIGLSASVQLSYATVISELIPNKHRGVALGILVFASTPAQAFSVIIARGFVLHTAAGWRWNFYLGIITSGVSVVLYYICYHPPTYHMLHARRQRKVAVWKMLDPIGGLLFTIGLTLLLLGISWGGQIYPWKSGKVIGTIVSGSITLIGFVFFEIYGAGDYPLIPMHFFKNSGYVGVLGTAGIAQASWAALLIIWPIQLTVIWNNSYALVGWKSCIVQSGTIIGLVLAGLLIKPLRKQKLQMIVATSALTAFIGAMAGTNSGTPTMALMFILISCICVGYIEVSAFIIGPFTTRPEDLGVVLGLVGTSRASISSVVQAVFVTILQNELVTNVPKYVIPAVLNAGLPETSGVALLEGLAVGNFTSVPGITPTIIGAAVESNRHAYVDSFKIVYLSAIAFSALAIGAAVFVPNCETKFDNVVSRKLQAKVSEKAGTHDEVLVGERSSV